MAAQAALQTVQEADRPLESSRRNSPFRDQINAADRLRKRVHLTDQVRLGVPREEVEHIRFLYTVGCVDVVSLDRRPPFDIRVRGKLNANRALGRRHAYRVAFGDDDTAPSTRITVDEVWGSGSYRT